MFKFKKKYEKIDVSNEHVFRLDYDGEIRIWTCVVGEEECVTYEGNVEKKHLKIMNKERAPHVLQIDTVTSIYGELIPFQLENGIPFIKLDGEWVSSDNFQEAKLQAKVKMYNRQAKQEVIVGVVANLVALLIWLVTGNIGDWWILNVFGIFFISSGAYQVVRVRNELQAIREAEVEAAADEADTEGEGIGVAAARAALEAASEEKE